MKRNLLVLSFITIFISIIHAQSYVNPESMVFDTANNRYLISNKGGNTIVQLDSEGVLTDFVTTGLEAPKGLLIIGDTLISVNNTSIQGFLLSNASQVINYPISGSVFMNDAVTDNHGYLYVSDSDVKAIYKLKLSDGTYSVLLDSEIYPNGLLYSENDTSLIICSWGIDAKIQSFSLNDSTLTTLVATQYSNLDGLARDNCGNIYVSSWGNNSVLVYDSLFKNKPTAISTGHSGPADITINPKDQILAVPNFSSNSVDLISLGMNCSVKINNVSPANNSVEQNDSLKIDWDDVSGITGYELQYSMDSLFSTSVTTISTVQSDTTIKGLASKTKYFWRVRTKGGEFKSIFNDSWNFTTKKLVTGINANPSNDNLLIYPNPSSGRLHIHNLDNTDEIISFKIINLSGIVLKEGNLKSGTIELDGLSGGVYLIQLESGEKFMRQKIIIQ